MDLIALNELIKSETTARKFVLGFCWKNHQRFCPRCRTRKLYKLANGKRRCSRCGYTFHDFSRRFIGRGGLNPVQWLLLIKLFELEIPPARIADQLGMSHNTVSKGLTTIRQAILAQSLDARMIMDYGYSLGFGGAEESDMGETEKPPPVFGIIESGGWAFADLVPGLTAQDIIHFKLNFHMKTSSLGKVVYTDKFQQYQTLITCGIYLGNHYHLSHDDKGLYVDRSRRFWRFARERFKRYKGVSSQRFPLYIKEMEFRYNHREGDIFTLLVKYLCSFVPDLG